MSRARQLLEKTGQAMGYTIAQAKLSNMEFMVGNVMTDAVKLRTSPAVKEHPDLKPGLNKILKDLEKVESQIVDLLKKVDKRP